MVSLEDIETISKPLGELGEREVKHDQIKLIYEELKQIENDLKFKEGSVKQSGMDSDQLEKDVNAILGNTKQNKINEALAKIEKLNIKYNQMVVSKDNLRKRHEFLNSQISNIKSQNIKDVEIENKLRVCETESSEISSNISQIEKNLKELHSSKGNTEETIKSIKDKPSKFDVKDIDKVIDEIEDLSVEADAIEASIQTQDFDLDAKIKYQEELLAELMRQKQEKVRQAKKYIKQQEKYLKDLETQRQVCQNKSEELKSLVE